jgi:hypothetical protein
MDARILFTFLDMSFREDTPSRQLVNRGNGAADSLSGEV